MQPGAWVPLLTGGCHPPVRKPREGVLLLPCHVRGVADATFGARPTQGNTGQGQGHVQIDGFPGVVPGTRLADGLSVGSIILVSLDVGLHVGGGIKRTV
jgi:hypothetical protein